MSADKQAKDPVRPGELRHLVTWEYPSTTRDEYGQVNADQTFTNLGQRYAKIVALTSIEKVNEQPQAQHTYQVIQRFLPNLDASCRMTYRGKTYYITGIINFNLLDVWQIITVTDTSLGGYVSGT